MTETVTLPPIQPGDLGLDWSGASLTPAKVHSDGAKFMLRYSAGVGNSAANSQFKLCKVGEIAAAVNANVLFVANSEWYETRVTEGVVVMHPDPEWWGNPIEPPRGLEARMEKARHELAQPRGLTKDSVSHADEDFIRALADAGSADGAADLIFWKSRGLAKGASIYVSWDAAAVASKFAAVDAYLLHYEKALGGYYNSIFGNGAYAGTPYQKHAISKGVIKLGWRPNAGSWSNDGIPYQPTTTTAVHRQALLTASLPQTPAHILQTGNYWYNKTADENMVLRLPLGSHQEALAHVAPKPTPTPTPTPVPVPATNPRKDPPMIVVVIARDTVPKGKNWPGWFTWDGQHLAHLTKDVGGVDNGHQIMAACGQTAPASITYEQYESFKAGS